MPAKPPPLERSDAPATAQQTVLVMQGGGALGAYQVGVYQAMHEAGLEPDWVIGTSIGAVNAALIAGNPPARRLERLDAFWSLVARRGVALDSGGDAFGLGRVPANLTTILRGIPGFFEPNPLAWSGPYAPLGVEAASYYSTAPLHRTLTDLTDLEQPGGSRMRMTVGAVNVASGRLRYFDSREQPLGIDHVLASAALPPAFGAVRIDGQPYWDGGIYSNTPIEAVLDDKPRCDSLIFSVNLWHPSAPEPDSLRQVMSRHKDIQYASRADSHIARQKELHRLRHVIHALQQRLPPASRRDADVKILTDCGCTTTMHVAHLLAPRLEGEDATKDIDFTPSSLHARREAGHADAVRMLERAPWDGDFDPLEGVIEHRV
jgi:NTE family protein